MLKLLKTFNSITEAEFVKNILKEHNIESWVKKSGAQYPGDLGDSFGAELYVDEKKLDEAKDILDSLDVSQ